jgi:DNA-binding NarL/FixJ family response regulator
VAAAISINEETVQDLRKIFTKLEVSDRAAALAVAT